jgi:hypothetical protein
MDIFLKYQFGFFEKLLGFKPLTGLQPQGGEVFFQLLMRGIEGGCIFSRYYPL